MCVLRKVSKPAQGPGRQVAGLAGEAPVLVLILTRRVSRWGCPCSICPHSPGAPSHSQPLTLSRLSLGTQRPSLIPGPIYRTRLPPTLSGEGGGPVQGESAVVGSGSRP